MRRKGYIATGIIASLILVGGLGAVLLEKVTQGDNSADIDARELVFSDSMRFQDQRIRVAVADSPLERQMGLSHTRELVWGTGMLFVFPEAGRHGFWMKDMNYPIDMVWLDERGQMVHIEEAVDPSTYPTIFKSPDPAWYVLELPAGYVRAVCSSDTCDGEVTDLSAQWQTDQ